MFLEESKFQTDATLKIAEKKILQSVLIHISYQTNFQLSLFFPKYNQYAWA